MGPAWLERLVLELPDAVVVADADGHLVWANPAAQRIFGLAVADIVGRNALEFLPSGGPRAGRRLAGERPGQGRRLSHRAPGQDADGWKLVELIGANLVGKPPIDGLVWCLRDLTERRRWEVATNDIERFRSLVHNSASILMLLDRTGTVQSVSAAITRMLGHDQASLRDTPLEDLVVQPTARRLRSALAAALDDRARRGRPDHRRGRPAAP